MRPKLSKQEAFEAECIKESKLYICGSPLFPPLASNVIVREAITCASLIELQYYNSVLIHFRPTFVISVVLVRRIWLMMTISKNFKKIVCNCTAYLFHLPGDGKSPFCKMPSNVAKR